jgi:hypothetical protein
MLDKGGKDLRVTLGRGICSYVYANISKRNLQYPSVHGEDSLLRACSKLIIFTFFVVFGGFLPVFSRLNKAKRVLNRVYIGGGYCYA